MPLQATSGAASYDGFGGGVVAEPNYIESCFSTYLYTGAGTSNTITNNIDLSTNGGLVWTKLRSSPISNAPAHRLSDSAIGVNQFLSSNNTNAKASSASFGITAFNTDGYTITNPGADGAWNYTNDNYVSWTFRKQPKFFDVVTYTGTGSAQTIAHSLGSVPGCIIVKATSAANDWLVYHTSLGNTQGMSISSTSAAATSTTYWNNTSPTSTQFTVGTSPRSNENGTTFVAYVFAHNAGGFGLTGTDNVISCGSYTGNGSASGPTISLGYEPQWVMIKNATDATNWAMFDNMRGIATGGTEQRLYANTSGAEVTTSGDDIDLTATGFAIKTDLGYLNTSGSTFIYIAIRRGPMKVPTSGTSVFAPIDRTGTGSATTQETGLNGTDLAFTIPRTAAGNNWQWVDRIRGGVAGSARRIQSNNTSQEFDDQSMSVLSSTQTTISYGGGGSNSSSVSYIVECFKRAPSFFDEVCYTGTGSAQTLNHNLGVPPELVIRKKRNAADGWEVAAKITASGYDELYLNQTAARTAISFPSSGVLNSQPTSTTITATASANTFVNYLFATCAGVSKVGSYTGNGSSQTINCGFTGGARFVMVKATSTTGDWMVADSARGIVSGNDPYLELNNTNAEVTGEDWLDTDSTGFVVNEVSGSNANTNGVTYIFLAIA